MVLIGLQDGSGAGLRTKSENELNSLMLKVIEVGDWTGYCDRVGWVPLRRALPHPPERHQVRPGALPFFSGNACTALVVRNAL